MLPIIQTLRARRLICPGLDDLPEMDLGLGHARPAWSLVRLLPLNRPSQTFETSQLRPARKLT